MEAGGAGVEEGGGGVEEGGGGGEGERERSHDKSSSYMLQANRYGHRRHQHPPLGNSSAKFARHVMYAHLERREKEEKKGGGGRKIFSFFLFFFLAPSICLEEVVGDTFISPRQLRCRGQ